MKEVVLYAVHFDRNASPGFVTGGVATSTVVKIFKTVEEEVESIIDGIEVSKNDQSLFYSRIETGLLVV